MTPSIALAAFVAAYDEHEDAKRLCSSHTSLYLAKLQARAEAFDQAVYDMALRAKHSLPLVGPARPKRGE